MELTNRSDFPDFENVSEDIWVMFFFGVCTRSVNQRKDEQAARMTSPTQSVKMWSTTPGHERLQNLIPDSSQHRPGSAGTT